MRSRTGVTLRRASRSRFSSIGASMSISSSPPGRRRSSPCRRTAPGRTWCRARTPRPPRARWAARARTARALHRIDGDVDAQALAAADVLAVEQHRRLVLLALADHHDPVHLHRASMWRIASTAAWSAAILSPDPTQRAAAMAAASVTRTSSRARFRSGTSVTARKHTSALTAGHRVKQRCQTPVFHVVQSRMRRVARPEIRSR